MHLGVKRTDSLEKPMLNSRNGIENQSNLSAIHTASSMQLLFRLETQFYV